MSFIRKRDPRYKTHLALQAELAAAKANSLPAATKKTNGIESPAYINLFSTSGSSTPKEVPIFVPQPWQQVDHMHGQVDVDDEWAEAEGGEEYECVACRKTFRSEAAWSSHERSKKHLKELERLRREMLEDEELFGLGAEAANIDDEGINAEEERNEQPPPSPSLGAQSEKDEVDVQESPSFSMEKTAREKALNEPISHKTKARKNTERVISPPHNTPHEVVETKLGTPNFVGSDGAEALGTGSTGSATPELSKREKRRAREAAKKARQEDEAKSPVQEVSNQSITLLCVVLTHVFSYVMFVKKSSRLERNSSLILIKLATL